MRLTDVDRLADATPSTRNRVVDFLRAVAICTVVLGHWLIAAVTVRDGSLHAGAVLDLATWTHPLTWVFQVMPVFFVVGGYANGLSWRAARRRNEPYATWLRARLRRLATPVVPLLLVWVPLVLAAWTAGVDGGSLHLATQVALVPTWFLAAYVVIVALAPAALALWERWGWASVVGALVLGGLVDWWSIAGHNDWVGFANYVVVWGAVHQLGYAWLDGRLGGPARRFALAAVGLAGLLLLVRVGPYPVSMIGVAGETVNNSYPTRVTLGLLGLFQAGLLLAAEPALARWLQRPRPWRFTIAVNARIMTIYLWHLTAMVLVIAAAVGLGGAGLGPQPLSPAWWVTRPLWYAVLLAVTACLVAVFGRFETPTKDTAPPPPLWRPVLGTLLVCGGLGLMAALGFVSADGVRWWLPLVPVLGWAVAVAYPRPGATVRAGGRRGSSTRPTAGRDA